MAVKYKESRVQMSCVKWFRYQYPGVIIASFPNGGYRTAITASIMKAEGQLAGMPDLFVPVAKHGYHGLFIEMKSDKGKMSSNQIEIHAKLTESGYNVEVCRSFEDFSQVIDTYLK